jgi:hypothetical protein
MRDKVCFLTDLLEATFATKMTCHRGGRWAFNGKYARLLAEKGYLADCSVTPLTSWVDHAGDPGQAGGPDYSKFPRSPYFLDLDDISRPGKSCLLEIPVTVAELHSQPLRALGQWLPQRSLPRRVLNRLSPFRCLFALSRSNLELMLRVAERSIPTNSRCLHLALHSSNLMPGGSPEFPKPEDVEMLYEALNRIFAAVTRKFCGATVTEFRREFREA